jgi:hypothetical protein
MKTESELIPLPFLHLVVVVAAAGRRVNVHPRVHGCVPNACCPSMLSVAVVARCRLADQNNSSLDCSLSDQNNLSDVFVSDAVHKVRSCS